MACTVNWDDHIDNTLRWEFMGNWRVTELKQSMREMDQLAAGHDRPINAIVFISDDARVPPNGLKALMAILQTLNKKRFRHIVFVTRSKTARTFIQVLSRVVPFIRGVDVAMTLDDAYQLLGNTEV